MLQKAGLQHLVNHLSSSSQVLMRVDYNVPIKEGKITDPKRIKQTIPTIQEVLKRNPKSLVLLSHMGRPNGQRVPKLSLRPVAAQLEKYLNRKVTFLEDCVGESIISQVKNSKNQIFLCENVRYHPQQIGHFKKGNDKIKIQPNRIKLFQDQISQLGNCFVNDAFGTVHRPHSSVIGVNHKFKVGGLLMEKQLDVLGKFLQSPKRPVLAILGGAKVSDKLMLVKNMLNFADEIILGGGMKNPFLTHVFKREMGSSINIMPENPNQLNQIVELAKKNNKKLHFPVDYRVARSEQMRNPKQVLIMKQSESVPKTHQVFDIGPQAGHQYDKIIQRAGSIFWNGPVGVIQTQQFRKGSEDILNSMIRATAKNNAVTIVGGGDSASLVTRLGVEDKLTFVSTGGGATIQLFEGKQLPGVKSLSNVHDLLK